MIRKSGSRFSEEIMLKQMMARTSVIETESPEWQVLDLPATSAWVVGNPGIEPGRHKGAGFTGPLSPQT